eukprot:2937799-Rhodomonas_salina.4
MEGGGGIEEVVRVLYHPPSAVCEWLFWRERRQSCPSRRHHLSKNSHPHAHHAHDATSPALLPTAFRSRPAPLPPLHTLLRMCREHVLLFPGHSLTAQSQRYLRW